MATNKGKVIHPRDANPFKEGWKVMGTNISNFFLIKCRKIALFLPEI